MSVRRVITGHDLSGTAKVLIDGAATNEKVSPHGPVSRLIWCTDAMPVDIRIGEDAEDMGTRILGTAPPVNGTRFTVNDLPPGSPAIMHRTDTLDYVIVISGEVDMQLDDSTVSLSAGDVMVQRGTNHAWINRGATTARLAFVLIDAAPLGIGAPVSGAATAGGETSAQH